MTTIVQNDLKYIYFIRVTLATGKKYLRGTRNGSGFRSKSNAVTARNRAEKYHNSYPGSLPAKFELVTFELTEIKDQDLYVGVRVRRINFPDQVGNVVEVRRGSRFPYVVYFDEGYDIAYKLGEIEACE